MMGASAGTSNVGKRRNPFLRGGGSGARHRRTSFDNTLPKGSPDPLARCRTAAYTSSSSVTVVLTDYIMMHRCSDVNVRARRARML